MRERLIEYMHNGTLLEAYLAWDETRTGPRPAVMISHAWAGRSEFEQAKARALAELGYAGFALDMYGKNVLGTTPEQNTKLMTPFMNDRRMLQGRQLAALAALREQADIDTGRVAAMVFCFGGLCVLDLARAGADVRGVVSFHGLLAKPDKIENGKITAKVLVLHGHDDPMVSVEQVVEFEGEMSTANVDWQVHAYGATMHSFTNPAANNPAAGTVYNPRAERRSWASLVNFLAEVMV